MYYYECVGCIEVYFKTGVTGVPQSINNSSALKCVFTVLFHWLMRIQVLEVRPYTP